MPRILRYRSGYKHSDRAGGQRNHVRAPTEEKSNITVMNANSVVSVLV